MALRDDAEHVSIASLADWRRWLRAHHTQTTGIWLVYAKKDHHEHVAYVDTVEEALCFGWIDSTSGVVDENYSKLWFAPRKRGSGWARTNKERVERLIASGRMTPAGLAVIEAAQADGSWTALDAVENMEEPDDLVRALAASPHARTHWDGFPPGVRKQILQWIATAKRPDTRARRIDETARLASKNIRANQWERKG